MQQTEGIVNLPQHVSVFINRTDDIISNSLKCVVL